MHPITIRPFEADDRSVWTEMWAGYCAFYEVALPLNITESTWQRILDSGSTMFGLLALDKDGVPLGFAHYVLHPNTWSDQLVCYLEDLFVRPESRHLGAGSALIKHLIDECRAHNWGRLYWMTKADNTVARALYDRFCQSDGFVRYALTLQGHYQAMR